jgi:predicted O-methyltransferase YrrM
MDSRWLHNDYWSENDGRPSGWFKDNEGEAYANLVSMMRDCSIAEVGVYHGRSLSFILPICRENNIRVLAIDDWSIDVEDRQVFEDWIEDNGYRETVETYWMSSTEAASKVEDGSLSLVMLDASHGEEDSAKDIEAWLPKLKKHGIICGHDYNWPGIQSVVNKRFGVPTGNLEGTFWWFSI